MPVALAPRDTYADGGTHACANTGRLATVIRTGGVDSPALSQRRRSALGGFAESPCAASCGGGFACLAMTTHLAWFEEQGKGGHPTNRAPRLGRALAKSVLHHSENCNHLRSPRRLLDAHELDAWCAGTFALVYYRIASGGNAATRHLGDQLICAHAARALAAALRRRRRECGDDLVGVRGFEPPASTSRT